jgi:DNA-binding HxlR family transcriptional regulator
MRAGGFGLSVLATPLHFETLVALERGQRSLTRLREATGSPPQSTLRARLKGLTALGIVERAGTVPGGRGLEFRLTDSGNALLEVSAAVDRWLADRPAGPLDLTEGAGRAAVKALVDGWSSPIVRALAARPLSLTELDRLIPGLNYPTIERRLQAMRLAGQIEACKGKGRSNPYAVTGWLRRGVAPLIASARWERRHLDPTRTPPIRRLDVEAAFLLAIPPLNLGAPTRGDCRLSVRIGNGSAIAKPAGVRVVVKSGRILAVLADLDGPADAWIDAPASAWIDAVTTGDSAPLGVGGDISLAAALLDQLHAAFLGRNRTPTEAS